MRRIASSLWGIYNRDSIAAVKNASVNASSIATALYVWNRPLQQPQELLNEKQLKFQNGYRELVLITTTFSQSLSTLQHKRCFSLLRTLTVCRACFKFALFFDQRFL